MGNTHGMTSHTCYINLKTQKSCKKGEIPQSSLCLGAPLLAQGQTQGSMLQQCTNKTLTTGPFSNTCEADEVSPKVEAGGVVGLKCLQPSWDTDL
jgi:hypothetical protein